MNPHPNHPLCQAVCAAAIFFEVVAKFCTMATNFLRLFNTGSARLALVVGASEVGCGAGEGRIYTWSVGSGHFMAWAVDFWGFSIYSFPLPSSANIREVYSFFSRGQTAAPLSEDSLIHWSL